MAKEAIGKEAGYSCSYVPLEILDSFGIKTTYVMGDPACADTSQSYLSQNICGFAKDICSRPRGQVYDMILTDCCDAMVKIHEAYKLHQDFENDFSYLLTVPRSYDPLDIDYFPKVLDHFIRTLETATGKTFSEARLGESIKKFNRLRKLLIRVEKMLLENAIWGSEYVKLMFGLYDAGVDKSIDLIGEFIEAHKNDEKKDVDYSLLFTGSNMPAAHSLADHIEEYDGNVRYFDTCNLARYACADVSEELPPLTAIAEAYLTKAPCPRMKNSMPRMERLIRLIKAYDLDVVVYHTVKFCASHIYDYIYFKELCEKNHIPLVRIETNHEYELPGQVATRLEAALEML